MLEELKQKAEEFMNSQKVQSAINTAKEKAEELKNNEKIQSAMAKAKERWNIEKDNLYVQKAEAKLRMDEAKGKAEDYIREKTDGKGILGFGKTSSNSME